MEQRPGRHGRAGSDLDGEAVELRTGLQRKGRPETAKRPIRHRHMRLGNSGPVESLRQLSPGHPRGRPAPQRGFHY